MASFYHGSIPRHLVERAVFYLRQQYKAAKKIISRTSETKIDPIAARHFTQIQFHVTRAEWDLALAHALEVAKIAETNRDTRLLGVAGDALIRLGACKHGWRLKLLKKRILNREPQKTWNGKDISDRTLVVECKGHIATGFLYAGFIEQAARRAKRCIAIVDPRLVQLYRRTFSNIEVRSRADDNAAIFAEADVVAENHYLGAQFAPNWEAIEDCFVPFRPDPALVSTFRGRYLDGNIRPLIGIAWGSKNRSKQIPSFEDWAELMRALPATYISLQYGSVSTALRKLRNQSGMHIIEDPSVNQFADMDRFAAQVAALDAVISVSNTIAHTAGAVNVPTVVLLDDVFALNWPFRNSAHSGWYPKTRLVRKRERDWGEVMQEARLHIRALIDA